MRGHFYDTEEDAEVSMSPLIDCVFLLLIFFLVSTMMKKINKDIDIQLPQSISAERQVPTNDQIVIGIKADGKTYLDGHEESLMSLHQKIRQYSNSGVQVRIDTDRDAPLYKVVEVADLCQFNQLDHLVLRSYDEHYNKRR